MTGRSEAGAATLEALRLADAMQPVPEAVAIAARAAAARFRDAAESVIFYGSVLRDGAFDDRILDFYVVVKSYRAAYGNLLAAAANRLLPPNVYYVEAALPAGGKVRSKVAVISRRHLGVLTGNGTFNSTLWARFAQPVRIAMAVDAAAADDAARALAQSVRTLARSVMPLLPAEFTSRAFWNLAFANTYRAELRAERQGKGSEIYDLNMDYFDSILNALARELNLAYEDGFYRRHPSGTPGAARMTWAVRRVQGKALTVARLIKAAFTFDGGADYLAWKISRHSGVAIHLTPWQRRHPVLGGVSLFIHLWRQRAFR
jgi:predicted nucleotidyltransferase